MCTAGFPEPRTFSWRVRRALAARRGQFDVVHDNQTFGRSLLGVMADGWPLLGTCHHPITVDRALDLAHAPTWRRRVVLRRWYGFVAMQKRVARRIPRILTVSSSSKRDIVEQYGISPAQLEVVPVGVDDTHFRPRQEVARVPGRIMTTASADVPFKGLLPLVEAVAKLRTERPEAHLVVVGRLRAESPVAAAIARLGLSEAVTFESGVSDDRMVELFAEATVAVVPSLYEGFSLPAVEAMACGVPLVATTGGALPEVVGESGTTGMLVPPGDPSALAAAIGKIMGDPELAGRLAANGRRRVMERFTWRACAVATAENYRWTIEHHRAYASLLPGSC
jgi:glycosyltransferase involved in cell wall biosynthesis